MSEGKRSRLLQNAVPVRLHSVISYRTVIQVPLNCDEEEEEEGYAHNTRRLTAWEADICCALAHGRVAVADIARRSSCGNYLMKANCKETMCEFLFEALFI